MKKFIVSLMVIASVLTFASCKEEASTEKPGAALDAAAGDLESDAKKAESEAKEVETPEVKAPEVK
ncbi:hypothetical protein LNTAR_15667 [Lentisphaera araneosa HTCC2155]|jgi:hypothetical protein|uniref:Uncharacterized protein n=1 Tax=Lentisphaera araneosa HTCC2155 TaxID=313628 RepID=A6DMD1_9BACT|nr:hypothetical protein [Lentisphaera araneosa]EDM27121.1 hypothetical protein LNTAR_15667 [Lentisphaera araneosa HTCC2155]